MVNEHCVRPFFNYSSITALCCASGLESTPGTALGPLVTSVQPSLGTADCLSSRQGAKQQKREHRQLVWLCTTSHCSSPLQH